ncbi:IS256 family transposase [Candidatus Dependentiae bacterium]|nr:IS256 family transposase [Candidatus Dependentiae bacterium]
MEVINRMQQQPEKLFEMMRLDIKEQVSNYLSSLMEGELSHFLGRDPYERVGGKSNHRNGNYPRKFTIKNIGEVNVKVPRDRNGDFQTSVLPRSKQYENEIALDMSLLFLSGVSTRSLSMLSKRLLGRKISHGEISKANKELSNAVENWRMRDLSNMHIKYIYIDGVNFKVRIDKGIKLLPILAAIGVKNDGTKTVLSLQAGDKESARNWRQFFKDLKSRGLRGDLVQLGIMDGLSGLEKVFKEEFINSKIQRCQVHVRMNVMSKVTKKLQQEVGDDLRSIFYASSKKKALEFNKAFVERWEKELPSATKSLQRSLQSCLTYHSFPEEEWISLRTTNVIERLNKEFKRRTKPMEIMAGEISVYRILAFICLKMELHWKSNPVGKVKNNLPFFKEKLAQN